MLGYTKRVFKKKYKRAVMNYARKIPRAFEDRRDMKAWVSAICNARMDDLRKGKEPV